MEAAKAAQQRAQLDTENTVMHSALAGRVADRSVRVGQYVQPGARLLTVVPAQQTYLEAYFKETQIGQMRIGQPALLHIDAFPDIELHGDVASFAPGTGAEFALLPPENATGNFTKIVQRVPVRIHLDAGNEMRKLLLPGLSVRVDIDTRSGRESNQRLKVENGHG
jgi:membrane fusion protein (multidrug efflux system)